MGSVRHETVIDVDLDTEKANAKARQLQALIDQLSGAMSKIGGGGPGGGSAAGTPGAAAPSPQPGVSPHAPTMPTTGPAPAPAPVAPNVTPGTPAPQPGAIVPVAPVTMPHPAPMPTAPNVLPGGGEERRISPGALTSGDRPSSGGNDDARATRAITTAITSVMSTMTHGGPGMALGVAQSGIQGLSNVAQTVGVSGAAVPILGALAGAAGVMLAGLNYRYGVAVRRAQLDERTNQLGLYGGGGWGGGGYTPEEAVGLQGSFGQGAGYSRALRDTNVLRLNRTGTGIGAMAGYAGLTAAGVGGEGNPDVESLIASAQNSGLRGSKVDEYLQRITAAITSLGENGMSLNLEGTEKFMRRLANTGAFQGAGLAQTRLFTGVEGAAVSARSKILSNYANIGENALMGAALRQGGGVQGAAEYLGSLSTDEKRQIITREYGADAAQSYFMSLGLNEAQGRDATGQLGQERYMGIKTYGAGGLKTAYAASERRLLGMIGKDDAKLFQQKSDADAIIMKVGEMGEKTIEKLQKVVDLLGGISDVTGAVHASSDWIADTVNGALNALKKL